MHPTKMTWIPIVLMIVLAAFASGENNDVVYMHLDSNETQPSMCLLISDCYCSMVDGKKTIDCSSRDLLQLPNFGILGGEEYDTVLLNDNRFTRLLKGAFQGLNVRRMVLSNNSLSSPSDNAFQGLDMLEELLMDNCSLSSTPVGLNSMTKLKHLELQNNDIHQITENSFQTIVDLEYLDLSGNPISITDTSFEGFLKLEKVKKLFMSNCGLYNLPHDAIGHMTKLTTLDLSKNKIWNMRANFFSSMTDLVELDLSDNPIKLDSKEHFFRSLNKLQLLKFSGCKCEEKKLHRNFIANLKKLREFSIRSCDIHQLDEAIFSHMDHLKELDLGGNHFVLKSDIFQGVSDTIQKLYMDDAGLVEFPYHIFEPFLRLKHLYVRRNQIEVLHAHVFRTLAVEGVHVYLQENKIKKISSLALQWSPRPIYIHLENNKLKTLSFLEKDPCRFQLATMYLRGNNISCNCDVFKAVQMKAFTMIGRCSRPSEFKGLRFSWRPNSKTAEELYIEKNITSCDMPPRYHQRYECTCGKWVPWDSTERCGVIGIADRPASFAVSSIFATIISLFICSYLR